MLEAISQILADRGLINAQWFTDTFEQGKLVRLYREYYDGYHRMLLTKEMKAMLNITDERLQRYNANYCELIIGTMADRLTVEKIEATAPKMEMPPPLPLTPLPRGGTILTPETMPPLTSDKKVSDPAKEWVDDLLDDNRFDALQIAVREAVLRDGETFIMSEYDDDDGCIKLCHEPAYDSETGVVVIYERGSSTEIACAIKIWYDVPKTENLIEMNTRKDGTYMRANIYFPDHTEKYHSSDGTDLSPLIDDMTQSHIDSTVRDGKVPGVPIVRFHNKNGVSELVNVIPLQDSLNSLLVDLVMSAQLTAFSVFFAVGVDVPQGVTPGMVIRKNIVDANGAQIMPSSMEEADMFARILSASRLERIQGGDLTQIIGSIDKIINQISVISSTPLPGSMGGDSSSGEALKQRDTRLLGKLTRAQVQLGNSWEDVVMLAALQTSLFSPRLAPQIDKLNTIWKSAEIRNNADILALFKLLNEAGFTRAALRALGQSSLASYSEADIDRMMAEKAADGAKNMIAAAGSLNGFDNFNLPTSQPSTRLLAMG